MLAPTDIVISAFALVARVDSAINMVIAVWRTPRLAIQHRITVLRTITPQPIETGRVIRFMAYRVCLLIAAVNRAVHPIINLWGASGFAASC
jgi:hypothetical protein